MPRASSHLNGSGTRKIKSSARRRPVRNSTAAEGPAVHRSADRDPNSPLSAGEIVRRGRAIYDQSIRPLIEKSRTRGFVAVDVLSGSHEVHSVDVSAIRRLLKRRPDAQLYLHLIGSEAAHQSDSLD